MIVRGLGNLAPDKKMFVAAVVIITRLLTGIVALLWRKLKADVNGMSSRPKKASEIVVDNGDWYVPTVRWPPRIGDNIEMLSRYIDCWFPAVVIERGELSDRIGWPPITVRIIGNAEGAIDTDVQGWEILPINRLAAARREPCKTKIENYDVYDESNISHMCKCDGCPDCDGLSVYYRKCTCKDLYHHVDSPCRNPDGWVGNKRSRTTQKDS